MTATGGHLFYIVLYREKHIGMKHHLVNLYQVCSNYIPGAKNGLP